jgi:hypothetical protein
MQMCRMKVRRFLLSADSGEKCGDLESLYGKTMVGHLLVAASECLGKNGTLGSKDVGAQRMMSRMFDSRLCAASERFDALSFLCCRCKRL